MAELTEHQIAIRDDFIQRRGYWADDWQMILELAPDVMDAYTDLSAYGLEHGCLDAKTREFLYIATTASVTHSFVIGIKTHSRNALRAGATPEELVAVYALVSGIGVSGYALAVAELEAVAPGSSSPEFFDAGEVAELEKEFERVFGVWDETMAQVIRSDPGYFRVFLRWAAIPRLAGVLSPRDVALISIVVNASVTHLDARTLRREIAAGLGVGVTPAEILEACNLTAGMSVHALTLGVPILAELLAEDASGGGETTTHPTLQGDGQR